MGKILVTEQQNSGVKEEAFGLVQVNVVDERIKPTCRLEAPDQNSRGRVVEIGSGRLQNQTRNHNGNCEDGSVLWGKECSERWEGAGV